VAPILVTGGTGFIGRELCKQLSTRGHHITVLCRDTARIPTLCGRQVEGVTSFADLAGVEPFGAIVNLAGDPIFGGRWSESRKQIIQTSRVGLTDQLVDFIAGSPAKPAVLVSGSAIGFYGDQAGRILHEDSEPVDDFSHRLCRDWERSAQRATHLGVRVCLIRTGLVLGRGGGLLQRMILPFRAGLGGRLGDGSQWMSWIHLQDHVAAMLLLLDADDQQGVYNLTAPNPVTNREFTASLATAVQRPALLHLPAGLLKLLLGEMASLVLGSQRVLPERLKAAGFSFAFPTLEAALGECLSPVLASAGSN
jgi:uncharacterized protein